MSLGRMRKKNFTFESLLMALDYSSSVKTSRNEKEFKLLIIQFQKISQFEHGSQKCFPKTSEALNNLEYLVFNTL